MRCSMVEAEMVCEELWETFQFQKNDLLRDKWVNEFIKYPLSAVEKGVYEFSKTIRPRYIPTLETVISSIQKNNTEKILEEKPNHTPLTERQKLQFSVLMKSFSTNLRKIKNGSMTQAEHLEQQAELFEDFGMPEDAEKVRCSI